MKPLTDLPEEYYSEVAAYFDIDSSDYENRYNKNHILQKIRTDFRKITEQYEFNTALEIGCGPGIDLMYFSGKYPLRKIFGIDISPTMVELARIKINSKNVKNAIVEVGIPENASTLFPDQKFDLVYCYFGALNTVYDLQKVAEAIRSYINKDGVLVLTFVNRWYFMHLWQNVIRFRFKKAFSRINGSWKGYSPSKNLESRCRSAREIHQSFSPYFDIEEKRGYSILFPAWYRYKRLRKDSILSGILWFLDKLINKTPLWNLGEYSLYVLNPRKNLH